MQLYRYYSPSELLSIGDFSGRLQLALDRMDWTVADLAKALTAKHQVVAPWLKGTPPGGAYMVRLPGVLGVNGHWLLTGEGVELPPEVAPEIEQAKAEGVGLAMRAFRETTETMLSGLEAGLLKPSGQGLSPADAQRLRHAADQVAKTQTGTRSRRRQG